MINFLSGRGFFWTRMGRLMGKGATPAAKQGQFARPNLESPEAISFLEGDYQGAIDNDARLLAVFTAGPDYQHDYCEQILEALPKVQFGKRISLHFLRDCDHTFMRESKREYLYALIAEWLQSQFPGSEPTAPVPGPESTMESVEF